MFTKLIEKLKKNYTTLVFTEGADPRILEAASRLKREDILQPLLIGDVQEVRQAARISASSIRCTTAVWTSWWIKW